MLLPVDVVDQSLFYQNVIKYSSFNVELILQKKAGVVDCIQTEPFKSSHTPWTVFFTLTMNHGNVKSRKSLFFLTNKNQNNVMGACMPYSSRTYLSKCKQNVCG